MTDGSPPANAGIYFPPPFLFVIGLGLAWLLEKRVARIHLLSDYGGTPTIRMIGMAVIAIGFLLAFWGMYTFARAKTAIIPHKPATQVVQHGPYAFTRNPMYTGMATAYVGGSIFMNSAWALILLPFVMLALYQLVIRREENYLSAAFPEEYSVYRSRVGRWL
jgi:protein-S-isoprenylcysteine O-methyltransferase Ste14